jgi:hypothetical protein
MIVARMSLPADLTLAFPSAWPHIRQLVALYDPDDREPDAGPPPGWSRRVELPDDPGVALVRSVRPARTPARRTSPERLRRHADQTVGEPSYPTPAPIDPPPAAFDALVAGWMAVLRADYQRRLAASATTPVQSRVHMLKDGAEG